MNIEVKIAYDAEKASADPDRKQQVTVYAKSAKRLMQVAEAVKRVAKCEDNEMSFDNLMHNPARRRRITFFCAFLDKNQIEPLLGDFLCNRKVGVWTGNKPSIESVHSFNERIEQ